MSVSVHITGGDLPGLKALRQRMQDANKSVLVGVPASAGNEKDEDGNDTGTSLALVAATVHFGHTAIHPDQPERPFLTQGIEAGREKFHRLNAANLRAVVLGKKTVEESLDMLGVVAAGEVQREMRHGEFAENAQSTKDKKGSSQPTIDTAQLAQSITFVREGEQSANAKVLR